ncbi:MAG: TetR/AcrR family transcriptional regulator [Actinobacteria bacterium]|nr:TetR/AcrR family transcriptional regulator [Actinomycetota bacterium]MCG2799890.1 TetR/AcrR family transcriptional regulator [Cellulomonas sp.]
MDLEDESPARRRRGSELEDALLDAAWDEVVERGYTAATYEGVAARAGTSRSVIYRRWPTKRELVLATVERRGARTALTVPDTGSLREDLIALLDDVNHGRGQAMLVLGSYAGEFYRATGLTPDDVRDHWLGDRTTALHRVIDRAVARGEVDPARVTDRTVRLASDLLRQEILMTMRTVPKESIRAIVDEVVVPVLTGAAPRG